jgi:3-oxoacyl-[acyl-carrier-protein] synthase II
LEKGLPCHVRFGNKDEQGTPLHRAGTSSDPIVITGIGMIASVGDDRESVWKAVRSGRSGARHLQGFPGIPDGLMLGALVDIEPEVPGQLKAITLCQRAAAEAIDDAAVDFRTVNTERFACAISGHMGDTSWAGGELRLSHLLSAVPWWHQWLPNTACSEVANRWGLNGPRLCHSTACASGLVDIISAVRALDDGQCDMALAGSAEAVHPLFAAGFQQMRVLAYHDDPQRACRPFDETRNGFIMGEGAAMFVLERLSHARRRGARIYAEVLGSKTMADAHHLTGLDVDSDTLVRLISDTLRASGLKPRELAYINAHGTGTQQNDLAESRGIRRAMGTAADALCVSATKSILGHLVNAAGSVELAITTLAMRDGFLPPTLNLTRPDPQCDLDCIPLVGRSNQFVHAMKLSVAFGGHLAAIALRRWNDARTGFDYPSKKFAA